VHTDLRQPPAGLLALEGAVSRPTVELLERAGFKWVASSANVLHGSLQRTAAQAPQPPALDAQVFNRPYRLPGSSLIQFFREDTLSDLIGFTYATWHGDDAAHNLVDALAQLARQYAGNPGHMVLIALDGENAWEHYPSTATTSCARSTRCWRHTRRSSSRRSERAWHAG
ncbi:Glycoside hydrolase, family 57, core domain protein, partial [mine drainage metagenome]